MPNGISGWYEPIGNVFYRETPRALVAEILRKIHFRVYATNALLKSRKIRIDFERDDLKREIVYEKKIKRNLNIRYYNIGER